MSRQIATLVAILAVAAAGHAAEYQVDCQISRGDPKGSKAAGTLKTVVAPKLIVRAKESSSVLVGGHVPIGAAMVPVGQEVEVTAAPVDGGGIKVHAVYRLHSLVGEGTARQVSTRSEETTAVIQPGGAVRVKMGNDPKDQRWVDVTVQEVK